MQSGEALLSLSDAGNWASLASLVISIFSLLVSSYAALSIRRVRTDLINRATLPALLNALDRHVVALGGYMQDFEKNKNDFDAELAGCGANLTSIQQKITDTTKVNVYSLQWKIARYKGQFLFSRKGPQNSEQDARTIYNGLIAIQQQLKIIFRRAALWMIKLGWSRDGRSPSVPYNGWAGQHTDKLRPPNAMRSKAVA
jgi:hypothetical protein